MGGLRITSRARLGAAGRAYLTLAGLASPIHQLTASFAVLCANGATILAQPDLTLTLLATLPEDQALLRRHVFQFRDGADLGGGILGSIQALHTIANAIQNIAHGLMPIAARLDKGNTDGSYAADLESFRSVLAELSSITSSLDPDSGSQALVLSNSSAAINAFVQGPLGDDLTRFQTAETEAQFSGEIDKLKLQISGLQSQIDGLNNDIAGGATSQILPALQFGFSIGKDVSSAMTDPGKLVLNVGFAIKGEVDKANAFAKQMQKKNDDLDGLIGQYRDLVEALAEAEQEMSVLLTIAGHCSTYNDNITAADASLKIILGQIQLLHDGIDSLSLVDTSDTAGFFADQLSQAVTAWKDIGDACANNLTLLRNLGAADPAPVSPS